MKQLPVAVAIFDKNLNYIFTSNRWTQETNLNPDEIIGKNIYEVVPDIPEKWRKVHQQALKGEYLNAGEDVFNRQDGSQEWWRWRVMPWYELSGEIGGIALYVEKITERKLREIKMKGMLNALNRSNAELERFAHICAHDLNEPLRTVAHFGQLLEEELIDIPRPTTKGYLEHIMRSIKHLAGLIDGILSYSQVGSTGLKKAFFSLQAVMDAQLLLLDQKLHEKNAFVYFDKLPIIYGDKILIGNVFRNLMSNAIKFNKSEIPIVYISYKENKNSLLFCVEDNGIGIESTYQKKIFDLFKRLHHVSEYEGTGMGLSTSKKIIEAHGGRVWVKSIPNEGSKFYFTLSKS